VLNREAMTRPLGEDAAGWNLGRYTLHGEIASGGMATVHIGRLVGSAGFAKMVAIKRLHAQFARDPEFVTMFLDEARLAARVLHPNVVQPLDVIATDSEVFLVMEYVRGESLSKLQRFLRPRDRRVPLKIAGAIMVGLLHGLHAAHEATNERGEMLGIVHRDVSPQNVIVGTDGVPRVLDFGIAKASDRSYHTREGDLKGKLAYMSPEQLTGESEVDRRTDVYAASIVLWEMLTGRRLFDHDYQSAIIERTAGSAKVAPPSTFVKDLPPELDAVVLRGLSRHPHQRYATAREMAIQLEMVMPMATPSKVGEWVEEVAAESLARRAQRIAEIEHDKAAGPVHEQARELLDGLHAKRNKSSNEDTRRVGTGSLPPPPMAEERMLRERGGSLPPPPPMPYLGDPSAMASGGHPGMGSGGHGVVGSGPHGVMASGGYNTPYEHTMAMPGGAHRPASMPPPRVSDLPPPMGMPPMRARFDTSPPRMGPPFSNTGSVSTTRRGTKRTFVLTTLILLVLALVGVVLALPWWVKRTYVTAARERGIVLTVEDVEMTPRRIRLLRCSATAPDMPGVYLSAKALDFSIRDKPRELLLRDVEVTIDSPFATMRESVDRYLMAHPLKAESSDAALHHIRVEKGYLVWSRVMGDNTKLEFQDIHGDVAQEGNRALGDDYTLTSDRISVVTPLGNIGPWRATLVHRPTSQNVDIGLGVDGPDAPKVTFVGQDPGGVSLDVKVPRSTMESIGLSRAMFGIKGADPVHLEGTLSLKKPDSSKLELDANVALYGLRANGASAPVDIHLKAHAASDPKAPVPLEWGFMTYGSFRGKVWGKGWFSSDSVRFDGGWKTAPRACAQATNPDPAATVDALAKDPAALDHALLAPTLANQTWIGGSFAFDSRDISAARLTSLPLNRCGSRNFP